MSAPSFIESRYPDITATMRRWGLPIDDASAAYWPSICAFIAKADDELSVLDAPRRKAVAELSVANAPDLDPREQGVLLGAFWECLTVAHGEKPGVAQ